MSAPSRLDVLRFPLRGSRLIEASAGTGKTWTIAAFYLRLVLGHADPGAGDAAPMRAYLPSEILVMTFTRPRPGSCPIASDRACSKPRAASGARRSRSSGTCSSPA